VSDVLLDELAEIVGPRHVLRDADLTEGFATDWTGRWRGSARAVVRPASTEETAAAVACCAAHGAPIVPQGGNTGLVGGGVPRPGEPQVVLSLRRLDDLGEVATTSAQVSAGAGVTLARLQDHAKTAGLEFAVDLTARQSATVGGMIATNAGGLHVLRYGSMRAQTIGVEAVLANGTVVSRMGGLVKDNSGYDLTGLLCGSEGTLAVITAARLRLVPRLTHRVSALLALADIDAALTVLARLRLLSSLEAAEVMFSEGIALVGRRAGLPSPFPTPYPCFLLAECAGAHDPSEELINALADLAEIRESAVASDGPGRERLWSWREGHTEAVNSLGVPHKLDVTLALGELARFVHQLPSVVEAAAPGARLIVWGHLGDGNLHINAVGPAADDDAVDDAVLHLVADHDGSISAEHGIGVAKLRWLPLTRTPADIAAMAAVKRAFDPHGILNPGVLLPGPL
jgi:FAD/FMN-containing dehydrogenase